MSEDVEKTAYGNLYPLMQHYSSLLFNGRVSIITICVILWAYILGVVKDSSDSTISVGSVFMTTKMMVSLFAAFLMPIFSSIENVYFKRFLSIVRTGKILEKKFGFSSYFSAYNAPTLHPFIYFYFLNSLAFSLLFIYITWHLNQVISSLLLSICIVVPFIHLFRTYRTFLKSARETDVLEPTSQLIQSERE
jgi:hypothetical protein